MGDMAYRERKVRSAKARKELLTTLGAGITTDGEGVMGGNKSKFGGKIRFGKLAVGNKKGEEAEGK